jgi:hypothetical protein
VGELRCRCFQRVVVEGSAVANAASHGYCRHLNQRK